MRSRHLVSLAVLVIVASTTAAQNRNPLGVELRDPVSGGSPPAVVEIEVDCDAGDRIAEALRNPAPELVVHIRGICREDVEIRRDNVTLIGGDPDLDGIRSAGGPRVLTVRGASNVRIENLKFPGPPARLFVGQSSSDVQIVACDLIDARVEATQLSYVSLSDVVLGYLQVELGAWAFVYGSKMTRVRVADGGVADILHQYAPDNIPFGTGGQVQVVRGTLGLYNVEFVGPLEAHDSSLDMTYSYIERGVTLTGKTRAELLESNDVYGPLVASGFSTVYIEPDSTFWFGDIACLGGADVSCDGVNFDGFVQGCPACEASSGTPNPLTFRVEGTIVGAPPELGGEVSIGDPFSMTYTFNAAAPGSSGLFETALWTATATLRDWTWTGGPGSIRLFDDDSPFGDMYNLGTSYLSGPPIAGYDLDYATMTLYDPSGMALTSMDNLPVEPPLPFDSELSYFEFGFGLYPVVRGKVESITLVEPFPAATIP